MGNLADYADFGPDIKKPRESRGSLDAAERTRTSTGLTPTRPSTFTDTNESVVNCGVNDDASERLHHWLHLIAESDESSFANVLIETIAKTLGNDALERLTAALAERAKHAASERPASN
jgi:hypothetical protein